MKIQAKICGLSTTETIRAAVHAGASYIGFVFFEKSPRNVTAEQVAILAKDIPCTILKVGVFVNPTDGQIDHILNHVALDLIQLHGTESPERVTEVKKRFKLPVMKAIAVTSQGDIQAAKAYEDSADIILFDAKAPTSLKDALPGGNGLVFDWRMITDVEWRLPWMLSGGLTVANIQSAIDISGAKIVDISSGVEEAPGKKNINKIKAFMKVVNEEKQ